MQLVAGGANRTSTISSVVIGPEMQLGDGVTTLDASLVAASSVLCQDLGLD